MLYDTHCHPYLLQDITCENAIKNFQSENWKFLNCIACDVDSSQTSIHLAQKYDCVYATIGVHPTHTIRNKKSVEEEIQSLEDLYEKNKHFIVAIGESWLDYYWLESLSEKYSLSIDEITQIQKQYFRAQINLAKKLWIPLIIHNRNASDDIFQILQQENFHNFVFHCFSESYDFARKLLDFAPDCMLWFWGIATFKNASDIQDVVRKIPLKNIIIETDAPYLTPTPLRGKKENEPALVRYVLSKIIDLREEGSQEITKCIFDNSKKFFNVE